MTGAILKREIVVPGRKLHTFLVRLGYALLLAAAFGVIFLIHLARVAESGPAGVSVQLVHESGEWLFRTLVTINIFACLLFTPAYVAGAISQEKDQRTMQDLLLTSMSSAEIVFSKLLGRLGQVSLVLAAGLPLVSIGSLLGRISGSMQLALAAMTFLWLMTAGSFTLLISLLVRRTRDAILGTYVLGAIVLISCSVARFIFPVSTPWLKDILDAFYPLSIVSLAAGGVSSIAVWHLIGQNALVLGIFSGVALLLAILLLRRLGVHQLEVRALKRGWRLKRRVRQMPDDRPMLWKEQCFAASGRIAGVLHFLGVIACLLMLAILLVWSWFWFTKGLRYSAFFEATIWFFVLKLLRWPIYLSMLLTSSAAFAGERERTTWDALLTSPLEGHEIVLGKLVGSLWEVRWWLATIALCFFLIIVQAIGEPESSSMWLPASMSLVRRTASVLGLVLTGTFGGVPGVIGLVGDLAFLLGVGLRTSLGTRTSGKSLAISLLIWFGSGIVFWLVLSMGVALVAFAFYWAGWRDAPVWLDSLITAFGWHLVWFGPLLKGIFWGGIGVWLIRLTVIRFDVLASRMQDREVLRLEGLRADTGPALSAPGLTGEGRA